MCNENMTSFARREDPFDLKKEMVVTYQPLALHNYRYALAQSLPQVLQAARLSIENISPTNFV